MKIRNFSKKKTIAIKDIRRLLTGKYNNIESYHGIPKRTDHEQPIIKKLDINCFLIIVPLKIFNSNITFVLAPGHQDYGDHSWLLFSNFGAQLRYQCYQALKTQTNHTTVKKFARYVQKLVLKYQIGLYDHRYFIRIDDYSFQNAYYRLIQFEIRYSNVIQFLIN